jgi:hypothetical protein
VKKRNHIFELVKTFMSTNLSARLLVMWYAPDREYAQKVQRAAADDPRCTLLFEFVTDAKIWDTLVETALAVFPFRWVQSSSSLLTAFDAGIPVPVADSEMAREHAEEWKACKRSRPMCSNRCEVLSWH